MAHARNATSLESSRLKCLLITSMNAMNIRFNVTSVDKKVQDLSWQKIIDAIKCIAEVRKVVVTIILPNLE